ncbi:MAG: hypothetical protein LBB95_00090 [Mycoplasmataceae bacterium]|jgi:phosphotransferase system IIB component|nr:hypothetical protein [Mycoplasmataceae bacterium]
MKIKSKTLFLIIFTFGIYYLVAKNKIKKTQVSSSLSCANEIGINLNKFIDLIGGINNIVSVTSTLSSVSIIFKSAPEVDKTSIKEFHIHGISRSYNKITFVFGDNSSLIANEINNRIKHGSN